MDKQKYEISISTINKLFNYLGQAPYQQVAGLVQEIQAELSSQVKAPKGNPEIKECKKKS